MCKYVCKDSLYEASCIDILSRDRFVKQVRKNEYIKNNSPVVDNKLP